MLEALWFLRCALTHSLECNPTPTSWPSCGHISYCLRYQYLDLKETKIEFLVFFFTFPKNYRCMLFLLFPLPELNIPEINRCFWAHSWGFLYECIVVYKSILRINLLLVFWLISKMSGEYLCIMWWYIQTWPTLDGAYILITLHYYIVLNVLIMSYQFQLLDSELLCN